VTSRGKVLEQKRRNEKIDSHAWYVQQRTATSEHHYFVLFSLSMGMNRLLEAHSRTMLASAMIDTMALSTSLDPFQKTIAGVI
jgi:hypothetical protein